MRGPKRCRFRFKLNDLIRDLTGVLRLAQAASLSRLDHEIELINLMSRPE